MSIHAGYVTIIESIEEEIYHIRIINQDIIMEFKHAKNKQIDLKELAQTALDQVKDRGYVMRDNTLILGMAHCGKNCEIIYEQIGK